jgi:APA family basic amino acid/polyamine antiporter
MQHNRQGKFQKRLGLFDATAIVTGSMIGSGIFIVSADIARNIGAPLLMVVHYRVTHQPPPHIR